MNAEQRRDAPPHDDGFYSPAARSIVRAVSQARRQGFVLGRPVRIGQVPGVVVAYNIGNFGPFSGALYPLVVRTGLGVTKCSVDELNLA